MRILRLNEKPIHQWVYLNSVSGGGTRSERLPLLRGEVDRLPEDVEAVIALSDLQGRALEPKHGGASVLLGEMVAEALAKLGKAGGLPPADRTGILLAGDLYASPNADTRGATGDVRSVWSAFSRHFRWVVGVAGNHDTFEAPDQFFSEPGRTLLDGDVVAPDGLPVGGVSYIIGKAGKLNRREQSVQLGMIEGVLQQEPEVLLLHEGPDVPERKLRGNPLIRGAVESWDGLVVCGHRHWEAPLVTLDGGPQILNVDARAVILRRSAN
jgi:3',5'-cyclic-AMP phosphodiesterase